MSLVYFNLSDSNNFKPFCRGWFFHMLGYVFEKKIHNSDKTATVLRLRMPARQTSFRCLPRRYLVVWPDRRLLIFFFVEEFIYIDYQYIM